MTIVGDEYEIRVIVSDEMVRGYAALLGDENPIHLDDGYAAQSRFGRRIAHGGILFGLISRVLGMHLPGPGTIFLSQEIAFKRPVYVGDEVTVLVAVRELLPKNGAVLTVRVGRGDDEVAVGTAQVKLPA